MKKVNNKKIIITLVVAFLFGFAGLSMAATTIGLGTADNFAILAGSAITNTGLSTVNGDVGSFPTLTQTGFGPGANAVTITGTNHFGDAVTQGAKNDLVTAYNNAAQPTTGAIAADLGGQTLTPGVYQDNGAPASLGITGTLTLDGQGDPNAVFIFKSASTLTTSVGSNVNLIGSAQACNVFWQLGDSATLGTNSNFTGNILAMNSITDNGSSTINGRLLARNAAVTLNNTTVSKATCAVVVNPTPTSSVVRHSAGGFLPGFGPRAVVAPVVAVVTPPVVAPVVKTTPGLPKTGFNPEENNSNGIIQILTLISIVTLLTATFFYISSKKEILVKNK